MLYNENCMYVINAMLSIKMLLLECRIAKDV